jgi:hypothetical protein
MNGRNANAWNVTSNCIEFEHSSLMVLALLGERGFFLQQARITVDCTKVFYGDTRKVLMGMNDEVV